MYFANWTGHSMVLPDNGRGRNLSNERAGCESRSSNPVKDTGTGVTGPAQNQLNDIYDAARNQTAACVTATSTIFGSACAT